MDDTKVGAESSKQNTPADVAKAGSRRSWRARTAWWATTLMTKVQGVLNEILPETVKAAQHRGESEPGSAQK